MANSSLRPNMPSTLHADWVHLGQVANQARHSQHPTLRPELIVRPPSNTSAGVHPCNTQVPIITGFPAAHMQNNTRVPHSNARAHCLPHALAAGQHTQRLSRALQTQPPPMPAAPLHITQVLQTGMCRHLLNCFSLRPTLSKFIPRRNVPSDVTSPHP
jgi:hypothetical protein